MNTCETVRMKSDMAPVTRGCPFGNDPISGISAERDMGVLDRPQQACGDRILRSEA